METWKPLKNFPGYEGSTEGRIRNIRTQHISKPTVSENGYAVLGLRRDGKTHHVHLHKELGNTFLEERSGMDVRHKDENLLNNRVDNLEWCTRSDTVKRAYDSGAKKPWRQVPVKVIETGEIYGSFKDCAAVIGCDPADVRKCAIGERKSAKGLHFELV